MEEVRLLKAPKKNSGNSSIPPSKDEIGLKEQVAYASLVESLRVVKRGMKVVH